MGVQVVFEKPGVSDEDYVYVGVTAGTDDDHPNGFWQHVVRLGDVTILRVQHDNPEPIRDVWEQALSYAQSQDPSLIYVDDPEGEFPADELGVWRA